MFLLAGDKLTLVDTGFKGRSEQILKNARRLGYSAADITGIIVTHHHADHIGSLAALKKVTQAKVIAHPADAPYIEGRIPQLGPARTQLLSWALAPLHRIWETNPVIVDMWVKDGDELPILGGTRVLHTPGHTPGRIFLFLAQEKAVFVGDVLAHRFGLGLPSKDFTVDLSQEIDSIRKLASIDFEITGFGHGAPLTHNACSAVRDLARKLESNYKKAH